MPREEELPGWADLVGQLTAELPEFATGVFVSPTGEIGLNPEPFPESPAPVEVDVGAVQMIPWEFCLTYAGRPYATQVIAAPSPELAALTAEQYVALLNAWARTSVYPPSFAIQPGRCEI
jgi:hypothetical protein